VNPPNSYYQSEPTLKKTKDTTEGKRKKEKKKQGRKREKREKETKKKSVGETKTWFILFMLDLSLRIWEPNSLLLK